MEKTNEKEEIIPKRKAGRPKDTGIDKYANIDNEPIIKKKKAGRPKKPPVKAKEQHEKKAYKLSECHIEFICQKLGEDCLNYAEIQRLFNSVYDTGKKPIRISSHTISDIANNDKWKPLINDFHQAFHQTIEENKYARTDFMVKVVQEQIEDARKKGQKQYVYDGTKLLAQLCGNLVDRVDVNNKHTMTDDDIRRIAKEVELQKNDFLQEYDPEKEKDSSQEPI